MKIIYQANDGTQFDTEAACKEHETQQEEALDKARSEDFEFMVLCAAKGNMAMYDLLRDRSLDKGS